MLYVQAGLHLSFDEGVYLLPPSNLIVTGGMDVGKQMEQHKTGETNVLERVSEEQNKTKLNYVLVGRLCDLESP